MSEGKKEILLGDCLELMKDIPNGSIDMILCDLPYGTTACKWDTIIPFDKLWEKYERIIKQNGAIVLFGAEPFTTLLRMSNFNMYKYDWIWNKTQSTSFGLAKKQPMRTYENIAVFYKKQPTYNPIMTPKTRIIDDRNWKSNGKSENGNFASKEKHKFVRTESYPKNIIDINSTSKECNNLNRIHPTQKPIELFEYLVKTYTNEGELVLDNTAGSGTTAIACLNTNRQFIVMEKEQKYYDIILKRVGDFNKKFEPQTLFGNEM
jgi:site-specific DNA-methyltransferase (adenine-specific)